MKRLFVLLFVLALVGALIGLPALLVMAEAMPTGAAGLAVLDQHSPSQDNPPTATNEPTPAAAVWCHVTTGIENGRANIRACGSLGCAVLTVAQEGDALEVLTLGEWLQVKTGDNTTGFIFSQFCKKGQ